MRILLDVMAVERAAQMDFVIEHVRKRAVLREETEPVRSLTPVWRGTWAAGARYDSNALVNHKSGLWVAERSTASEPGTPESGWRLAVKSPR